MNKNIALTSGQVPHVAVRLQRGIVIMKSRERYLAFGLYFDTVALIIG